MKISIITLFPQVFPPLLNFSILKKAQEKKLVDFEVVDLRQFGKGSYKQVDDRPYGGGTGMVLKADVLEKALASIKKKILPPLSLPLSPTVILTSPSGKPFDQTKARQFSKVNHLILICGHYEGIDQRFIDSFVMEELSIGDFVLTGGELPALVMIDSIVRLIPGVLEKEGANIEESFSISNPNKDSRVLLEYPHYTRPESFAGKIVPKVLLSGDHAKIKEWRIKQAILKTRKLRPDLLR